MATLTTWDAALPHPLSDRRGVHHNRPCRRHSTPPCNAAEVWVALILTEQPDEAAVMQGGPGGVQTPLAPLCRGTAPFPFTGTGSRCAFPAGLRQAEKLVQKLLKIHRCRAEHCLLLRGLPSDCSSSSGSYVCFYVPRAPTEGRAVAQQHRTERVPQSARLFWKVSASAPKGSGAGVSPVTFEVCFARLHSGSSARSTRRARNQLKGK